MQSLSSLVFQNNYEQVELYLQKAKEKSGGMLPNDQAIMNACRDAVRLGHERVVQLFLNENFNPYGLYQDETYPDESHINNKNLIYFAARVGNLPMVKLLVDSGVKNKYFNPREKFQDGMLAAIIGGCYDVVQYLLENGASANGELYLHNQYLSFLGRAAYYRQEKIVDILVQHGAGMVGVLKQIKNLFRNLSYRSHESQWHEIKTHRYETVQILFDCAMGINFEKDQKFFLYDLLYCLDFNVGGLNFVGISINCKPITREMLMKLTDGKVKGLEGAIVTVDDVRNIEEPERRDALLARLEAKQKSQGNITSEDGIVNLVPLEYAVCKGLFDVVKFRLDAGVDANKPTKENDPSTTPIVSAAKNGFLEIVKLLVESAEIELCNLELAIRKAKENRHKEIEQYLSPIVEESTPLHLAVRSKDRKKIEQLVGEKAAINAKNIYGHTPLYIAASNVNSTSDEDIALLKYLLDSGADPNDYDNYSVSPLFGAAKSGSFQAVSLLLPITEKKDIVLGENKCLPWYVPIMFDSHHSNEWFQILKLLKENGADFNAKEEVNSDTILALFIEKYFDALQEYKSDKGDIKKARFEQFINQLEFLLENGADPNSVVHMANAKETVLHRFVRSTTFRIIEGANERVVQLLLKYRVVVNRPGIYGKTPLHIAISMSDNSLSLEFTKLLIDAGANVKARDSKGWTPLHWLNSIQVGKLLIAAGADVKARNSEGQTPLHCTKSLEITKFLIASGADVTAKDNEMRTPLHLIAKDGYSKKNVSLIELLKDKGASILAKDSAGKTPFEYYVEGCNKSYFYTDSYESLSYETRRTDEEIRSLLQRQ